MKDPITVTVVGAGVAGLTVAHELAERGFKVSVVEAAMDRRGSSAPRVGGVAASPYASAVRVHRFRPDSPAPPRGMKLPGGHRFRFVPSSSSHIRDTLRRIPISGLNGKDRTVCDNLMPSPDEAAIGTGPRPLVLPSSPSSAEVLLAEQRRLLNARVSPKDLLVFLSRLLRYMSTCPERRAAECESVSLLQYLEGRNAPGNQLPLRYDRLFLNALRTIPGVPVDGIYGEARAHLNAAVQRLSAPSTQQAQVDGCLNGPASEVWFAPWRTHLEALGVQFHAVALEDLQLNGANLVARFSKGGRPWQGRAARTLSESDYLVLATDVVTAERTTRMLPSVGVPAGLRGYTTSVPPNPMTLEGALDERDPEVNPGARAWDRLQTTASVQLVFREKLDIGPGRITVCGSPWNLTAFVEPGVQIDPTRAIRRTFETLVSIDVLAWTAPGLHGHPSAAQSTRRQIAQEVWRQFKEALREGPRVACSDPTWYTVDSHIRFAKSGDQSTETGDGSGVPVGNLTPYLVAIASDWNRRPGTDPWRPGGEAAKRAPADDSVWQADHGGYPVHWHKLVVAGAYTRTFTRLTTLEAACESGRHAVNAILDHCGRAQPSQPGDYCRIWDPEELESEQLRFAKQIDRKFFADRLPHPWQLAGLDLAVAWLSQGVNNHDAVQSVLKPLTDILGRSPGMSTSQPRRGGGFDETSTLKVLQQVREDLERLVKTATGS